MTDKPAKTDQDWQQQLTPEQYRVCRQKGTEPAFSGQYVDEKAPGIYACAACGQELFHSASKYESGSGWPSFFQPITPDRIIEKPDNSHGMTRVEILCSGCESHMGHIFPDGPEQTGLRYCTNSVALNLKKEEPEK